MKKTGSSSSGGTVLIGDRALANRYGVTTKAVYLWREQGMPCEKAPNGKGFQYDTSQTDPFVAAIRSSKSAATGDPSSELVKATLSERKSRARLARIKAQKAAREERIAQGQILERDPYELHIIECVQKARDRVARLPSMLLTTVPIEFHQVLLQEGEIQVRRICDELATDLARGPE